MSTGVLLASQDGDLERGAGITYGIFGGLMTAFGAAYAAPLGGRQAALEADLRRDPGAMRRAERERMQGVADRFIFYRVAEGIITATGVGLLIGGTVAEEGAVTGVGLALTTEGGFILAFDQLVEMRAFRYLDHLDRVTGTRPVVVVREGGVSFGLQGEL